MTTTPTLADALRQCRDALHNVAIDCAMLIETAEAMSTVDSRKAIRVANAFANTKTLQDALATADAALAAADAASQPPADERAAFEANFPNLDCARVKSGWSRGQYAHPHVEAIWFGWQARASLAQPPAAPAVAGEVAMPEPVGAVIPEGSTEYADCVTLAQCRAYGDARAAAERERICAAIKAADDTASEADYMLDSDDCIKVARGQWNPVDAHGITAPTEGGA